MSALFTLDANSRFLPFSRFAEEEENAPHFSAVEVERGKKAKDIAAGGGKTFLKPLALCPSPANGKCEGQLETLGFYTCTNFSLSETTSSRNNGFKRLKGNPEPGFVNLHENLCQTSGHRTGVNTQYFVRVGRKQFFNLNVLDLQNKIVNLMCTGRVYYVTQLARCFHVTA